MDDNEFRDLAVSSDNEHVLDAMEAERERKANQSFLEANLEDLYNTIITFGVYAVSAVLIGGIGYLFYIFLGR